MTDLKFMELALALAAKGKGFTSPNPCVGAVVVNDGEIIGRGWHKKAGTAHAEVNAIDDALIRFPGKLAGATIYVTLEPCNHFGKTPPCTGKILENGITRVVVGCQDPNPRVAGGGIAFLREKGLTVESGILEEECAELIEDFIWASQHEDSPFVTLKCAATLDGHIATRTGDSQWITGPEARQFGHGLRHINDAILIGAGTLHADNPSLTARIAGCTTKDPMRIVLDSRATIDPAARLICQESDAKTVVITGPEADSGKKKALEAAGVRVMTVGLYQNRLDLKEVMLRLKQLPVTSLLIEGGGQVAASALRAGIVNKVCYFLAPKFLGGNDGIPVFKGEGPERIKDAFQLKKVGLRQFGQDFMVTGYLDRPSE